VEASRWDQHPETEAMRQMMTDVTAQMQDTTTGSSTVETYAVLAQVWHPISKR